MRRASGVMRRASGWVLFSPSMRILLLKRRDGRWDLPGGLTNKGENAYEGALRELKEEAGFSGRLSVLGERQCIGEDIIYTAFIGKSETQFPVLLSDEHTDYIWTSLHATKNSPDIHYGTAALLDDLRYENITSKITLGMRI